MTNTGMPTPPTSPDGQYYYFVSLSLISATGMPGFGEAIYITKTPVITPDQFAKMKKAVRVPDAHNQTILSITLLATPEGT